MVEPQAGAREADPVWARLVDQLAWYSSKSAAAQRSYTRVKIGQIAVGATVPVVAALSAPPAVTAASAAVVVVAEGAQQLFQWHSNWLRYRSSAEALKREKFLYMAGAGRYSASDRRMVLAERLESLISQENTQWIAAGDPHNQSTATASPPGH
ncbi:hypothetical protein B7C42_08162 [Nocardia cerradoensis]|uniref:DUF4231 domain-containing protein n=2 Tax=Nocardia cerradoensis TaxID=85688 RepID=A0A231GT62_9NOCA|nr:hypothetical protein B7C42_08162 [Nocardia cerradoensis]